jgi:hypothetical protein
MEMDGTCVSTRLGRGWSGLEPIDRVGKSLATLAAVVGVLTTISILLLFARWDGDSSRRPLTPGTALAAFVVSMASAVVALLGLYSPECRADGQSCAPALMSYVGVGGALCWASAGTILCFFAKTWQEEDERVMAARRDQPHQIELAACEYLVVPETAVEMPGATYGWGTPVAVATATAITPADGVATPDAAVRPAAAEDRRTTSVLIETVANEDGTTTKTRTTTVTSFDKSGNQGYRADDRAPVTKRLVPSQHVSLLCTGPSQCNESLPAIIVRARPQVSHHLRDLQVASFWLLLYSRYHTPSCENCSPAPGLVHTSELHKSPSRFLALKGAAFSRTHTAGGPTSSFGSASLLLQDPSRGRPAMSPE